MALHMQGPRTDGEYRSLLQVLLAADGACADPVLRQELIETGYVRRDAKTIKSCTSPRRTSFPGARVGASTQFPITLGPVWPPLQHRRV